MIKDMFAMGTMVMVCLVTPSAAQTEQPHV